MNPHSVKLKIFLFRYRITLFRDKTERFILNVRVYCAVHVIHRGEHVLCCTRVLCCISVHVRYRKVRYSIYKVLSHYHDSTIQPLIQTCESALQDNEKNIPLENKFGWDMEEDSFTKKRRSVRVWEQSYKNTEVEVYVELEVEISSRMKRSDKNILCHVMSCRVMSCHILSCCVCRILYHLNWIVLFCLTS